MLLQFSSAQGPEECCIAVEKTLNYFLTSIEKKDTKVTVLEKIPSRHGLKSALISIEGNNAHLIAQQWAGSVQWQCLSHLRPRHKRKNWFIGVSCFEQPDDISDSEIVFETMRSNGPGGQHVNKTESAVRATHIATGISVKVQSERSQHANKKLAKQLIAWHLDNYLLKQTALLNSQRHIAHHRVIRGNATHCFCGNDFIPILK
ncbi:peptide chain release factor H [Proteus myxofaciens]|uniref:Putative peptide chain release factor n=1 Tax=Proteus myxofaciens ATCC 19692 TaxID=1354337 RepID=A0A198FS11_9GAMM|nr:peptide chain release factor H [Proteus myxofaciens]OAT26911.1 putative peptide chain release factor [Proteus myxofaciens ATCC 19692]